MSGAAGWADLPWELLLLITPRLQMADVIRLRAVCCQWAWALGKTCGRLHPTLPPPENPFFQYSYPWLLLPKVSDKDADSCTFLALSEDRRYTISSLPQISDGRLVGSSSDGWVVIIDPLFTPRLLNPLTRRELSLPSLSTLHKKLVPIFSEDDGSLSTVFHTGFDTTFPIETVTETFCDRYLTKIILTSSPLEGGFVVAVCTFPNQESFLASAMPGDESWSPVYEFHLSDEESEGKILDTFEDVVYHKGDEEMLYTLNNWSDVMILKHNSNGSWDLHSMVRAAVISSEIGIWKRYIVLFRDDLLQIIRHTKGEEDDEGECCSRGGNYCQLISNAFTISKFDPDLHDRHQNTEPNQLPLCLGESCWVRVDSLGDQSIFLGYNNSFSMTCGDDHKFGPHRNKIYFADDKNFKHECGRTTLCDAGVYDMESKSIESLCLSDCRHSVWFMPTQSLWD